MKKRYVKRKNVQGVITVEMSYLIPIILLLFLLVIYTTFYYHDKNILLGAASETVALGAQEKRRPEDLSPVNLEEFYMERVRGKVLLFSEIRISVESTDRWIEAEVYAAKGKMQIHVMQRSFLMEPEKKIRRKRILEGVIRPERDETEEHTEVEEHASDGI